jgi:hypothetical protein
MGDDTYNYFGATVFWLYIAAALYFSTIIIITIIRVGPSKGGNGSRRKQDTLIFSILAAISFATLSTNMLNVLIQSYQSWSADHKVSATWNPIQVWTWSITSTLFQDFGEAIVASPARYLWVQTALLATLSVCLFMGIEGWLQKY